MTNREKVFANIAQRTGMSVDEMRRKSPGEIRSFFNKKMRKPFSITSLFPFIGRGNVQHDGLRSTSQINKQIDKLLGV
jgi:hypothetical protein